MTSKLELRIANREGDRAKWEDVQAGPMELARWVESLAPWQNIMHGTFAWEASIWSAQRCFEKFMRTDYPRLSYFYALEQNPGRDGYHVHALQADAASVYRKEMWAQWFHRYGRARIEPIRDGWDASDYCSKYVTKAGVWWDVKLQWHRLQALNDRSFVLRAPC